MTVRLAAEADLPLIVELGREAHIGSVWDDIEAAFDAESYEASCRHLMDGENSAVFVSERGTLWMAKFPLFFNHAETMAAEVFFYATKGGDALRREGKRWAEGCLSTMSRHDKTDPRLDILYRRAGYRPMEHTFIRRA